MAMQHNGTTEADLQRIQSTLEAACALYQRAPNQAAESLIAYRHLPNILQAAQYILERSTVPLAQFESIGALREAVTSRWDSLSIQQIIAVRNYLLTYVTSRQALPYHVQSQLVHGIAVITKRGWINSSDLQDSPTSQEVKSSLMTQIGQLIASPELMNKHIGMMLAAALIEEMESSSKATTLNLPWEFHLRCYQEFEMKELKQLFTMSYQVLKSLLASTPAATIMGDEAAKQYFDRSLSLLTQIVTWPFNLSSANILGLQINTRSIHSMTPGPEWRDVFVDRPDLLEMYLRLFEVVRKHDRFIYKVFQGLKALFSVYGDVFANEQQRIQYMTVLLQALLHLLRLGVASLEEMYQTAEIIHRFVSSFPIEFMLQVGAPLLRQLMTAMTGFTEVCIQALRVDEYDNTSMEVLDMLLECWGLLVQSKENGAEFVAEYAVKVFQQYIDTRLSLAVLELNGYDNPDHNASESLKDQIQFADQLVLVAQIGRTAPLPSMVVLHAALNKVTAQLQAARPASQEMHHALEELHWLLLIAGFFLCDAPEGETIMAPALLLGHLELAPGSQDPIVTIVNQILEITRMENSLLMARTHGQTWSPLVAETIAWFLQRWVNSYLLLEDSAYIRPGLLDAYSRESLICLQLVDFLMNKCTLNLTVWSGESGISHETCNIFQALATRGVKKSGIMSLQSWQQFLGGWTTGVQALRELPAGVQGQLVQAIARMGLGRSEEERQHYLKSIIAPIEHLLLSYLNRADFVPISKQAKTVSDIFIILECFRGFIKATTMDAFKWIYTICFPYLGAFVEMFKLFKDHSAIVLLILDVYREFAQYQLDVLPEQEGGAVLDACIALFQAYDACGLGKRPTMASQVQVKQREDEQSKEILTLLHLLRVVADQTHPACARVVFGGIITLMPMLGQELLEVRNAYFQVVSGVFHRQASQTPMIPDHLFAALMGSFQYGLTREPSIQRDTLDAIHDLAIYHFTSQQTGVNLLQPAKSECMAGFIKTFLHFLLSDSQFSLDLIEQASDAFLALICSEQRSYMSMAQLLIQEQTDQTVQMKLSHAFHELMANVTLSVEPRHKAKFRDKMRSFLAAARSLLRKR